MDITTGYGADTFLNATARKDPWAEQCFTTLVDLAVNHREFHYPVPTLACLDPEMVSALPKSLASLQRAAVLTPFREGMATNRPDLSDETLQQEWERFAKWAGENAAPLKKWIVVHQTGPIRRATKRRLGADVAAGILDFWPRIRAESRAQLTSRLNVSDDSLRFTFDGVVRGIQYYSILESGEVFYFAHPIRQSLLSSALASADEKYSNRPSWGRCLALLLKKEQLSKDPGQIAEIVASIKAMLGQRRATWWDTPEREDDRIRRERLIEIARECALPGKLKDRIAVELALAVTLGGILSIYFAVLSLPLVFWRNRLPGSLASSRFLRGAVEYPGLFPE